MSIGVYGCYLFKGQILASVWSMIQHRYEPFSKETSNAVVLIGFLIATPFILTLYIRDYMLQGA